MDDFLAQLSDDQLCNLLGGQSNTGVANTGGMGNLMEYGIPNAMTADGPQGIRIGTTCTAWPISTLLASTWDVDLVEQVGKAAAIEAHNNGIDIWLAPGMNIHRDPLCGRNFEYYSEDPLITGKMAAAITKGCQSEGVSITLKHFTTNNKETNRNSSDSRVSERALREIYLKGFEIAVKEAQPWSIMTSYNFLNGIETSENKELLTNITRGEWGYEGIFMTDWGNNSNHAREVLAGNDVKMPSGSPATLKSALDKGILKRSDLEACAERLMNLIMKVNIFKDKILDPPTVAIGDDTCFKAAENIIWSQTARGENTSDEDGGKDLGYCDEGAWTQYQISVAKSGTYSLSARSASNAGGGAFDVLVDGAKIASFKAVNTGGWQKWTTLEAQEIRLEAGIHTLRIEFTESGSNLNWLHFTRQITQQDLDLQSLQRVASVAEELLTDHAEKYTKDSAQALQAAIAHAREIEAKENPADKELKQAYEDLVDAIVGLKMRGKKSALEAMIAKADEILASDNRYVTATIEGLTEELQQAKAVNEQEDALQNEINEAVRSLTIKVAEARLLGDVDGDGQITTKDSVSLLRAAAEIEGLSGQDAASADVNGDGMVDTTDAVVILRYTSEQISGF